MNGSFSQVLCGQIVSERDDGTAPLLGYRIAKRNATLSQSHRRGNNLTYLF